jgi:4-carboxymuconolactone decarboxylase
MAQRIHLAAIVARDGRLLLVRPEPAGEWELPGGPFLAEYADPEAGMSTALRRLGVETVTGEEHFVETLFLPDGDGHLVYNLYAAHSWSGEPDVAAGVGKGWFEPEELDALEMNAQVRDAVLEAYGLRDRPDNTAELVNALQGQVNEVARAVGIVDAPGGQLPAPPTARRERALDVLRTLCGGAVESSAAAEGLRQRYGPLADDVIDFAFGDVWSDGALDRKTRSLEVVAMLGALGRTGPLVGHVSGALNHGATPAEVVQTIRMVAVYAGFPAALDAWAVVVKVFEDRGIPVPGRPI